MNLLAQVTSPRPTTEEGEDGKKKRSPKDRQHTPRHYRDSQQQQHLTNDKRNTYLRRTTSFLGRSPRRLYNSDDNIIISPRWKMFSGAPEPECAIFDDVISPITHKKAKKIKKVRKKRLKRKDKRTTATKEHAPAKKHKKKKKQLPKSRRKRNASVPALPIAAAAINNGEFGSPIISPRRRRVLKGEKSITLFDFRKQLPRLQTEKVGIEVSDDSTSSSSPEEDDDDGTWWDEIRDLGQIIVTDNDILPPPTSDKAPVTAVEETDSTPASDNTAKNKRKMLVALKGMPRISPETSPGRSEKKEAKKEDETP